MFAYLRSLDSKRSALAICRHFRRIAGQSQAAPRTKLFYLGSLGSPDGALSGESYVDSPRTTTALHDALRAGCSVVVEYLIQIGFNVTVADVNNQTATHLAIQN
ncbi:serine threonine protein kinase [Penicillium malachiteum]|uniref:Serine threonine protein kinase n=1 Tax=Penicillium malachiteum TaxID=1324776 RepID=A0AAD6HGG7_9EURO|nr:serine threonine protein kinase [Penicillium malachiteum]